jgi:hypothetical protein
VPGTNCVGWDTVGMAVKKTAININGLDSGKDHKGLRNVV